MAIRVVPPDPDWPLAYEAEVGRLRSALGDVALDICHIGSTAIRGIYAKPIIDMLLVVEDLGQMDSSAARLSELGYEAKGEFGILGRRYFRKNSAEGHRTHQVHSFSLGDPNVLRHIAFRDYMNAHPEAAQAYSLLKQDLAAQFPNDMQAYMTGKDAFVKQHEALALDWIARRQPMGATGSDA